MTFELKKEVRHGVEVKPLFRDGKKMPNTYWHKDGNGAVFGLHYVADIHPSSKDSDIKKSRSILDGIELISEQVEKVRAHGVYFFYIAKFKIKNYT